MNVGTVHLLDADISSPRPLAMSVWRNVWFVERGDILVTPVPLGDDFLRYVGETLGIDIETVAVICTGRLLSEELLSSTAFADDLCVAVRSRAIDRIDSCFNTAGVAALAERLGIRRTADSRFAAQCGADLLNRKSHFRRLAAGAGIPIAAGGIAHTSTELARLLENSLVPTGCAIVKRDDAAGGMGNITVTRGAPRALPGTRDTVHAGDDLGALSRSLWERLTDASSNEVVVESYLESSHIFYFEYFIEDDGCISFANSGNVRFEPSADSSAMELDWIGLDIPAILPCAGMAEALTLSARLAAAAAQIGYRGPINIDAIRTAAGDIVFNETNARWGGGSVMHALGERIVGKRYADSRVVSSVRGVAAPKLRKAIDILRDEGLLFNPATKAGVVVLACPEDDAHELECVVVDTSIAEARKVESRVRAALSGAGADRSPA